MIFSRSIAYAFIFFGLIVSSCHTVFGGNLYFNLDSYMIIQSCFADDMEFDIPQQDFLNHSILDVLSPEQQEKVHRAFIVARETEKSIEVSYELKQKLFSAKVIPLFNLTGFSGFSVIVSNANEYGETIS